MCIYVYANQRYFLRRIVHTVEDTQTTDTFARPAVEGSGTFGREGSYSCSVRRLDFSISSRLREDVYSNSVAMTSYESGDAI